VSRQVVQTLANVVESGVHDPRLKGITFTSAIATDDLRTVRVFFTVFGDFAARDAAAEGLKAASGYLRREVARGLSLRYVPALHFEHDETLVTAERIEKLLHRDDAHEAPDEDSDEGPDADPGSEPNVGSNKDSED
jgi:ribosome-binding factor A